jgi:hypothetical protein
VQRCWRLGRLAKVLLWIGQEEGRGVEVVEGFGRRR